MSAPFKDRLFRGYGPLIGFTAVFLAVVLLVPSKVPENSGDNAEGDATSVNDLLGTDAEIDPETGLPVDDTPSDVEGATATDDATGTSGSGSRSGTNGTTGGGPNGTSGGPGATNPNAPARVAGCGAAEVPGDPYSPPCIQWSGGNGGSTARGVTSKEITVAVRTGGFSNGLVDAVSKQAGAGAKLPTETPEKIERTLRGLFTYFNKRFQFYGREMKPVLFSGKGDVLAETLGGAQEGAQADALKVAKEYSAFADISAVTPVYADALASKGIISTGAPYVSRNWLSQRRPYVWTQFTDCSTVVESVASYYATKMAGGKATNAAGALKGKPRRMAIVAPSSSWYQECVNSGIDLMRKQGKAGDLKANYKYPLAIEEITSWANTIFNKLKADGITTVVCGCDPIFLNSMTGLMNSNNYIPEMVVTGVALVDNDLVGSIMNQNVWKHAFGVSFAGATQGERQGLGYRAYKSVARDEPSVGVEIMYNQIYLLAVGIQMAGPNLTPASFEKGMFDYPRRTGPYGTWGFGPSDYSTSDDAQEVYWNPNAISVQTREKGAYINSNGGARYPIGKWPAGNPKSAAG